MTPAEFKTRYPAFTATDDAIVQMQLDESALLMDEARWGDLYPVGMAALVAHELSLAKTVATGGDGAITSKKVGEVQATRDAAVVGAMLKEPLLRTIYGQKYLRLRKMVGGGALAV